VTEVTTRTRRSNSSGMFKASRKQIDCPTKARGAWTDRGRGRRRSLRHRSSPQQSLPEVSTAGHRRPAVCKSARRTRVGSGAVRKEVVRLDTYSSSRNITARRPPSHQENPDAPLEPLIDGAVRRRELSGAYETRRSRLTGVRSLMAALGRKQT